MKMKKIAALALAGLLAGSGAALAAGFFTNGLPPAGGSQYPTTIPLTGNETFPADTNLASGLNPASEAITAGQIAGYFRPPTTLTSTALGDTPVNAALNNMFVIQMTANKTLSNPTNPLSGQVIRFMVQQDLTGSRTLSYAALYIWAQSSATNSRATQPGLSKTASAIDLITAVYNGVNWLASIQNGFQ
jgi:hypothetical protein